MEFGPWDARGLYRPAGQARGVWWWPVSLSQEVEEVSKWGCVALHVLVARSFSVTLETKAACRFTGRLSNATGKSRKGAGKKNSKAKGRRY
jgi:hypothetical protein